MGKNRLFLEKGADELLKDFASNGDQAPFEEIVRRYAGMVYSVCYRVASNSHDAEDATQAVFLSLALQARTGKTITYIGPWLQRVAHRLALDVKKSRTRRKKREEKLAEMNGNGRLHAVADPADAPGDQELKRVMQEELNAMPARYRMPLILHYFGGMNRQEMARELNCKPATLGVRVHRGRAMLGKRLAKRGMVIGASLPFVLESVLHASIPAGLIQQTAQHAVMASAYAGGNGAASAGALIAATRVIATIRIAAKAVMYAKLRAAIAVMLVCSLASALAGPTVVQSVKEMRLRLQLPWDPRSFIRPLLRSLLPELQVDARPQPQREAALASASPPIQPSNTIDLALTPIQPAALSAAALPTSPPPLQAVRGPGAADAAPAAPAAGNAPPPRGPTGRSMTRCAIWSSSWPVRRPRPVPPDRFPSVRTPIAAPHPRAQHPHQTTPRAPQAIAGFRMPPADGSRSAAAAAARSTCT